LPKKSQAGQELFDMVFPELYGGSAGRRRGSWLNPSQISNKKAILIIVLAGAFLYYFLVHRRK